MADYDRDGALQELEPSPVEETPLGNKEDYFGNQNNSEPQAQPIRSSTLGLSQHSPIWYLTRIQKYSSYVFTAYGAAHIVNTSIIPLITRSVGESERYVLLTRPYYQGIPAEPLLIIIPLYAHVLSGIALRIVRRNLNAKRYGESGRRKSFFSGDFWPKVSGISKLGYPLVPLLAGHVFINRAIPQQFPGGQSNVNLSYVAHAFAKHPVVSYAGFTALIGVGVWHITWGWAKWLNLTPEQVTVQGGERELSKKRRWYIINALSAAVTGLWMAGGFGVIGRGGLAPGYIARMYDQMYQQIPIVGKWL
ncbi:hypothetical protein LTR56_022825 [Elasticomyces elasticus]|uniref:Mitochondrial adapter protein MCP1 transmembrane domain-containing protein n=1 Tax=Elasticomyces elasticus TaxID=574655 RepID=A0AAN7W274_9PEZI|nr:hypothetical protein LTR56_022825 [Elasticomyces elasticus]KAK3627522.1 hypothetical protein LTR22_022708 [Elasticomyces elasticus]KAK4907657.1 hypothetical protein LTR49_023359 [Elasticomyces elasticus]KAK5692536.1 hypothetical protein LTR97_010847 [Elasticomyces elasticus]KAK5718585.1 hypothetical protein LTR15_008316 [Elasticomyces elasticus]